MQKNIILFLLSVLLTWATQAQNIEVKGTINGPLSHPTPVSLYKYFGSQLMLVGTVETDDNGNFSFKLEDVDRGLYEITVGEYQAEIIVLGTEPAVELVGTFGVVSGNGFLIEDSKENDAYSVLMNFYYIFRNQMDSLSNVMRSVDPFNPFKETKSKEVTAARDSIINAFNNSVKVSRQLFPATYAAQILAPLYMVPMYEDFPEFKNKYDNNSSFRHLHYFDYIDFTEPEILNNPVLEAQYFQYLNDYTTHDEKGFEFAVNFIMKLASANPQVRDYTFNYLVGIFNENGPIETVEYLNNNFKDECTSTMSEETREIFTKMEKLKPGNIAPELNINDINYQPVSLHNTTGKAKVIYFWASWCPHCMEETPDVYEMYLKYADKGLSFYAISLDKDYSSWVKAIQDMGLTWQNVSELKEWESYSAGLYNIQKTPTIILLDENNVILKRDIPPYILEQELKKLLK